ncbi:MAG: hypothetical protein HY648_11615 [Acidobacteria bacterium]|nr:hypothetical protein [Acidobacteriota bacterium]
MSPRLFRLLWYIGIVIVFAAAPGQCLQHGSEHSTITPGNAAPSTYHDASQAEAEKEFSEFNHHLAGFFILLVGLLALLEPYLAARFSFLRYFWCALFWIPGVYLLILSDPEAWPVGPESLHYVLTQDTQVLQHKIFSFLLIGLGVVEYLRVRHRLRAKWTIALFPAIAAGGAMLLLFHPAAAHAGGMDTEVHAAMQKIQHQHISFSVVGFGIALTKAMADTGWFPARLIRIIFALLLGLLGGLLITYAE